MNFIDIFILVPLAFAAWNGFKKGFIVETFTLLALLVGIYAGVHFSDWTSGIIREQFKVTSKFLPIIAFTITFLLVGAMVYFCGKVIERILKMVNLNIFNKLLGLCLGLVKMLYILSVLTILIESYNSSIQLIPLDKKNGSLLYAPVQEIAASTFPKLKESGIWLKNNVNTIIDS